ncbi:hypothetical protein VP1G_03165 [Cytospora mali]|uniref:Uncharacterized protein n=1 Tax=Cytospora mali TaxID=578113 RepID=A0A194UVU8_CYTMA|nr:hypothetical protein VP1G_03165 [Valsa mali var. pyri (nom. inval.)]
MLQLRHLTAAASVLLAGIMGTLADDPVQFLYPVDTGLIFHYLDRIDVSYQSNYSAPYLFTWCDPDDVQGAQSDRPDAYNATTEITLQFTSNAGLTHYSCDDEYPGFNSDRQYDSDDNSDSFRSTIHQWFVNRGKGGPRYRHRNAGDMGGRASPSPFQGMAELEEQQGPAELEIVSHSSATLKGKYAPVAAYSPQELPADYPGSEIEPQELPAAVDREHREGQ